MANKIIAYVSLCALLLLCGCTPKNMALDARATHLASEKNTTNTQKTAKQADSLNSWILSGAMSARNSKKAWSASVNWQQEGSNRYKIRLFGPLGGGAVMIEKQDGTVSYKDGPKVASSHNADQLLSQQTGIRLPVNNLYYWVRGLNAPTSIQSIQRDEQNNIIVLKQNGYLVEYLKYMKVGDLYLPNQIRLNGHGISVKFIIKHWQVG